MKSCSTCHYSHTHENQPQMLCRRFPPTAQLLATTGVLGRVEMSLQAFFAPVNKEVVCGEWKTKLPEGSGE